MHRLDLGLVYTLTRNSVEGMESEPMLTPRDRMNNSTKTGKRRDRYIHWLVVV